MERVGYDPNGNITSYSRNGLEDGTHHTPMDNLTYHYLADKNQLDYIEDGITMNTYTEDLKGRNADRQDAPTKYGHFGAIDLAGGIWRRITENGDRAYQLTGRPGLYPIGDQEQFQAITPCSTGRYCP